MARYVKVSTIGSQLVNSVNGKSGLKHIESVIKKHWKMQFDQVLPDLPDLIVINEMCDTPINLPYPRQKEFHTEMGESLLNFFRDIARDNNCNIAYSGLRSDEKGDFRNSTRLIDRAGKIIATYDKNYPPFDEVNYYNIKPGNEISVVDCDIGRVGSIICFDLNFEEIRARYAGAKPEILAFSSMYHGGLMQNYWAYSCRSFFIGAISGLQCTIISPIGEVVARSTNYFNNVTARINLDYKLAHLDMNWEPISKAKKKYGKYFTMTDPGYLAAVMLSSESDELSAADIVNEFGIITLDDYFNRYLSTVKG